MYGSMHRASADSSPVRGSEDGISKGTEYPAAGMDQGSSPARMYKATPAASGNPAYKGAHEQQQHQNQHPSKPKYQFQTLVLKVQVHCDACIRKVKKAIAEIDGVDSISVDIKQKRVTVTGNIDPKKVLKKVAKTGKQVELVSGKDAGNSNKSLTEKPLAIDNSKMTKANSMYPAQSTSEESFIFSDDNVNGCFIM